MATMQRGAAPALRTLRLGERVGLRLTEEALAGTAVLALASVALFGAMGVLTFILGAAGVLAIRPLFNLRELLRFSPLLLIPLLAILSAIWSDSPQTSMRSGLQLLLTMAAAIIICRSLHAERLVLALFVAFLILALSIAKSIPQSVSAGWPLVAFGSKNQAGFIGYMLAALALPVVLDRRQPLLARIVAPVAIPYALLIVVLSQSGATTTSILLTLIVFPPLATLGALKLPVRIGLVGFTLLLLGVASAFASDIEQAVANFRTNTLGKDATLTGRTYLWDFAERLSANRPVLGHGYSAFWRQGNIDAEGLWRWGGIASRSGFNFHNAFVEMRVDLGWVGLGLLALTCVAIGLAALLRQLFAPSVAMACLIGITAVNYVRSYVEDGLVAPFSLITLIWLATGIYAVASRVDGAGVSLFQQNRRGPDRGVAPPKPDRTVTMAGQRGVRWRVASRGVRHRRSSLFNDFGNV